ncbi:hypothetical protein Q8A67_014001 [Cirrhinus molitorella]|uniref:Ig-like domain-containing protein n=1 Tax=Cirrhinus molitorella TaxID=172907 RepID=A0AA88TVQ3_9TELE|nr:hypothetical protein Q8A67_014001 [Cirrhinus molitorella]
MMLIFGLMLLLQTASCLDRFCRFDQSEPCYAALEHKLNLQMVLDAGEYDLKLIKIINNRHNDPLCRVKNDKIKECDLYKDRPEMTVINGTLIKHVIRADSGNYRLELYDGGRETSRDLQVIVEAPIGSVEVSIICSSSGVVRVSCSSEGDQLLYSWTLNGDPLMDGDSSIYLGVGTDGNISCSVKNHVSHTQKTIRVKPCPVCSVSVEYVLVWCFQLMVLLGLLGGFHIYMRHTSGLDLFCWFTQSYACYAALGHKLNRMMVLDDSVYDLKLIKMINNRQAPIGSVEVSIICSSSGVMRVSCSSEGDQLLYSWTLNGDPLISLSVVLVWCFQLMVLLGLLGGFHIYMRHTSAPIGSVEVSIICSSSGVMRVSCSSEGDQLLYSWTLNGDPLMDGNSSIDLNKKTDGSISCSVKNHVSHTQKTIRVKPCPAPIGSVEMSIICSSSGVMRVSCSSEGDQLLYSWTLNVDSLMDGNSSIDLNEGTDGNICCSVKNHVSHTQKTIRVKPCLVCSVSVEYVLVWCFQLMVLLGLLGGFHIYMRHTSGLDRFCRFDQSEPCYAALEHKLNLQMMLDAGEYDLKLIKIINNRHDDPICRVKNDNIKECDLYKDRPETTVINGTLIIKHVIRADSGNYRLEHYDGGRETSRGLQVIVEAPIGSVEVSIICSSSGVMRVSCSSEGDQLLYSWTLNGDPLMDGNSSIDLDEKTDGNISCSVKNHISHSQKTIRVKPCPAAAGDALIYADISHEKKGEKKETDSFPADVVYAAVIMQTKRKEEEEEDEDEDKVQDREVMFTPNCSNAL